MALIEIDGEQLGLASYKMAGSFHGELVYK